MIFVKLIFTCLVSNSNAFLRHDLKFQAFTDFIISLCMLGPLDYTKNACKNKYKEILTNYQSYYNFNQ